jgi:hypothetical protein
MLVILVTNRWPTHLLTTHLTPPVATYASFTVVSHAEPHVLPVTLDILENVLQYHWTTCFNTRFLLIKTMSKLIFSLGAILALTAIFVIPSAFTPTSTQVAKASSCSASTSHLSISASHSGSCATGSLAGQHVQSVGQVGGSQSSCKSSSVGQNSHTTFFSRQQISSNGAVACSSNSP